MSVGSVSMQTMGYFKILNRNQHFTIDGT